MNQPGTDIFAQGEEARLLLSDAAARSERRNQPRYLLVASGGLVLVSLIWLSLAWWQRESASDELLRQRGTTYLLQRGVAEYLAEQASQKAALDEGNLKPDTTLQYSLEQKGREAGLTAIGINRTDDSFGATKNLQRKRYSYAMSTPQETDAIFKWIAAVQAEVPGVELASIDIEPATATIEGKARWKGNIAFTRWELK